MPWYSGPTLLEVLETVEIQRVVESQPLRFPVQYVNRPNLDFRGFSGTVASGTVQVGQRLKVLPSGVESSVARIVTFDGDLQEAAAGEAITLVLKDEIDISRGDLLVDAQASLPAVQSASIDVVWMAEQPLTPGSPHQQRVITIATTPAMGALLMPGLASALKPTFPQILLHNIAIVDAARQLDQRQVDLLIDTHLHSGQAISHHVLYQDRVQMYCRAGHPALDGPQDETTLAEYEFALLLPEGQRYPTLHRRLQEEMGERRCGFSTFNLMTQAAMIAGSDMLGLTTERLFAMVSRLWPLQTLDFPSLGGEQIDVALHFNKLSGKEPLLKEIIETVIRSFKA